MTVRAASRLTYSRTQWIGFNILIAMLYFSTGTVGLSLASPPGYATAVWPPSGIALGGVLLLGNRILPGILIGSMIANLMVTIKGSGLGLLDVAWLPPAFIAVGAVMQAAAGRWLVRQFAPLPESLESPGATLRLLALGGLVSTLVNATWSITLLYRLGIIAPGRAFQNWFTWWLGDSIGVFIFTPLVLAWALRAPWFQRARALVVTLVLTCSFGLSALAFTLVSRLEAEDRVSRFQAASDRLVAALDSQLADYSDMALQVRSLYLSSQFVDRQEFRDFVAAWITRHPEVRSLNWAPRVMLTDRPAFEARLAQETGQPGGILDRTPRGAPAAAASRAEYFPLTYVEPFAPNRGALGYDLLVDPERRQTLENAARLGVPRLTPPLQLFQSNAGPQPAFVLYTPVYQHGKPPAWENLLGFLSVVLEPESVLEGFSRAHLPPGYRLVVIDTGSGKTLSGAMPSAHLRATARAMRLHLASETAVGGRSWRIEIWPDPDSISGYESWMTWAVLTTGLICTAVLVILALLIAGRLHRLENGRRTAETRLEALQTRLDRLKKQARTEQRMFGRLLADIDRELRPPLNAMMGYAALASEQGAQPRQEQWAVRILHSGKQLAILLDDLCDLSCIKEDCLTLETHPFRLEDLLDSLMQNAGPRAAALGIRLRLEVAPDIPDRLGGDIRRLGRLYDLSVSLALAATSASLLIVRLERGDAAEGFLRLDLLLSSDGLRPDMTGLTGPQETPAVHADDSRLSQHLARNLATALGGKFQTFRAGSRTGVSLALPCALAPLTSGETAPGPLAGRCIELVCDEHERAEYLTELLQRLHLRVIRRRSTDNASAPGSDALPDLVVLDVPSLGDSLGPLIARLTAPGPALSPRLCLLADLAPDHLRFPSIDLAGLTPSTLRAGLIHALAEDSLHQAPPAPNRPDNTAPSWEQADPARLVEQLEQLDVLLRRHSFDAREAFERLQPTLAQRWPQPAHELAVALARLDFPQARLHLAVISELLETTDD